MIMYKNKLRTNYMKVSRVIVNPHTEEDLHFHIHKDEMFVVEHGEVIADVEDRMVPFKEGDIFYISAMYKHRLINDTDNVAELSCISTSKEGIIESADIKNVEQKTFQG